MPWHLPMAGVKHHEDLVAWQLSEQLRQAVVAILAKPTVARHRTFCDQIERSSRSAPSNIAEGFSRYKPREFARYLRIALGSLGETQNHLRAAANDKLITEEDFDTAWSLSVRAIKASKKLHSYLRSCPIAVDCRPRRRTSNAEPGTRNLEREPGRERGTRNRERGTWNAEPRTPNEEQRTQNQ